ncbi:Heat shock 70 kDa protein 12A [Lunasporangiospora selenospora]|uniref:Heat shock 70 kDa protein 12A n=1 Tax=Lunasporangiospora selenospora TaxID=979761 RepID=A0A9P6FNK5_9FUNG|nr:Heat shock 70 kDa protein 12A [Lunasporangiospora selenospora]
MSILTDKFIEKVKPNINLEYSFQLDIPGDPCFDRLPSSGVSELEDGGLTLHCDQLRRDIFDPEIGNVIDLIKQQLLGAKSCKGIFLVGGFGSSDYLQGCIRDALGDTSVSLFMPADAEMAVVRGAVYSGLNMDSINTRVARRSYGLNLAKPFREDVDPTSNLWELPDGRRLCKDRFVCMVRKGEKMNGDRVHDIPILISKGQYECSETFICAYDGSDGIPEYTTSSGVVRLGKIKVRGLFKETDPDGTEAKGTLRLYLGQCEIKATVILSNSSYSTRVAFDTTEVSR